MCKPSTSEYHTCCISYDLINFSLCQRTNLKRTRKTVCEVNSTIWGNPKILASRLNIVVSGKPPIWQSALEFPGDFWNWPMCLKYRFVLMLQTAAMACQVQIVTVHYQTLVGPSLIGHPDSHSLEGNPTDRWGIENLQKPQFSSS